MNEYKQAVLVTKLTKDENGQSKLPFSFPIYHYTVFTLGQDVTYSYQNLPEGTEVLAYIHVKEDFDVKKEDGYIGETIEEVRGKEEYTKHYNVTKSEKLATTSISAFDGAETKELYNGVDKDEVCKCWGEEQELKKEKQLGL